MANQQIAQLINSCFTIFWVESQPPTKLSNRSHSIPQRAQTAILSMKVQNLRVSSLDLLAKKKKKSEKKSPRDISSIRKSFVKEQTRRRKLGNRILVYTSTWAKAKE